MSGQTRSRRSCLGLLRLVGQGLECSAGVLHANRAAALTEFLPSREAGWRGLLRRSSYSFSGGGTVHSPASLARDARRLGWLPGSERMVADGRRSLPQRNEGCLTPPRGACEPRATNQTPPARSAGDLSSRRTPSGSPGASWRLPGRQYPKRCCASDRRPSGWPSLAILPVGRASRQGARDTSAAERTRCVGRPGPDIHESSRPASGDLGRLTVSGERPGPDACVTRRCTYSTLLGQSRPPASEVAQATAPHSLPCC